MSKKYVTSFGYIVFAILIPVVIFLAAASVHASSKTMINKDQMKELLTAHIEKHMPWPKGSVRMEFFSGLSDLQISGEDISYRVMNRRNEDFIGYSNFTIRFFNNGVFVKQKAVRIKLEVLRNVVVSLRYLAKGTEISSDDVKLVRKWFSRKPARILSNIESVEGKRLCTSVKQSSEITSNMLKEPLMVKKGKLVKMILEKGSLKITTIGLSKQDGAHGDYIKVKNVSSDRTILAKVMGESLVRVEF